MWRGPSRGPRGEYLPRAPPKERVMGKPTCATLAVSLPSLLSRASVRRRWRWRLWRAALGRCCALCSVSTRARDHLLQCHFLCYDLPLYARASWPLFGIEPFRCLPVRRVRKEVESAARGPASARGFHASATTFRGSVADGCNLPRRTTMANTRAQRNDPVRSSDWDVELEVRGSTLQQQQNDDQVPSLQPAA